MTQINVWTVFLRLNQFLWAWHIRILRGRLYRANWFEIINTCAVLAIFPPCTSWQNIHLQGDNSKNKDDHRLIKEIKAMKKV